MADFVFNIAAGKVAEYVARVEANDPTNSAIVWVVLEATSLEADATLKDYDTLAAILAGGSSEPEQAQYARVTRANGTNTVTVTDASDKSECDTADLTYSAVVAGDTWSKLVACYDPDTTGGADSALIPLVALDWGAVPDGSDLTFQFNASGWFRATT